MNYVSGGVTGQLGQALTVEVPGVKGKPAAKPADSGGAGLAKTDDKPRDITTKPSNGRVRFTAWARSYELFFKDPKKGGLPDFDRCRSMLDACQGRLDDLIILSTINIQIPKPADGAPTGKVLWDSDFLYDDKDAPDVARKLVDECHKRGIAVHAGYAVVDMGMDAGNRGKAFRKFLETASADQLKDHAAQCVALLDSAGFDGLSFDLEINGFSVSKHAAPLQSLFTELSSQMGSKILSWAGYPFLTDGKAPMANMNAQPYSLAKIGKNVIARPQAYRMASESMDQYMDRVGKTIKCALEDVGIPPEQLQIGVDYTGDSTFAAVRGDDMSKLCALAKEKKVGVVLFRLEYPGSPTDKNYDAWNQALNDGKKADPGALNSASGASPASSSSSSSSDKPEQKAPEPQPKSDPDRKHDPLAKGDEHENVRVLQFLLNYWQKPQKSLNPVVVTGKLDDPTLALMHKFQDQSGIAKTDAPDEATWKALEQGSAEFKLLGNIHPCALPLHTSRKWFANYRHEGKLSTRLFDQVDYGGGKSGKPILYITKNSTDDDGTSTGGDSTKQNQTSLRFEDGSSLDSTTIPFLAIGGAHTHDFGIKPGDVGAVIANGKVAFGVFGDSSGAYHDGTPGDDDMPGVKEKYGTPLFKCHRSGESSVKVHKLLDWKGETENSTFIWILFPGSSMCNGSGKLPKSVDSDAIQKRGAELLAKLTGGAASAPQQQSQPAPQQQQSQPDQSQPQQQDDRPLPDPIKYPGGYDMTSKKQNDGKDWPPSTPGTVVFIKDQKPPQPDAWKGCQFRKHSHFLPDNCVDMNKDSDKEYGHFPDIYGPAVPFTPLTQFTMHGFGGVVRCKLENGHVVEFGHFDHISAEVYYAAKDKKQLPAGTYLGKTTSIIGLSNGVHCHMQAVKSEGSRDLLTRDKWLESFGIPPERRWWPGKK
ncbi:MAG: hypothetical protein ACXWLM_01970 [Myxococcales bacterium]